MYQRLTKKLIHLEEVDSTNRYATDLIKSARVLDGTTVLARQQLAGRGQRSANWTTEAGKNLTFSTILFPDIPPEKVFYLNVVGALSVCKALSELGIAAAIKWPNDVLVKQKKISGILVENTFSGQQLASSVIGIGLNVNQTAFRHLPRATSVVNELGVEQPLSEVFDQLFAHLDGCVDLLYAHRFDELKRLYDAHFYRLGERAEFASKEGVIAAKIIGINAVGQLLLEVGGRQKAYDIKDVALIY